MKKTDSTSKLIGFPPLVKNVPKNWSTAPSLNKISLLWQYNYHDLYHKYSPYTNYKDSILSSVLSNRQPFLYTYIDEKDKGIISTLPTPIKALLSTVNITQGTINDVVRVGKFSVSSWGVQFLATQALMQRTQPFDETRLYNPLSPILSTISPMTIGLGNRPMRHIEGGFFGFVNSITSTIGLDFIGTGKYQTPSSTVKDGALPKYNMGQGKGLIRGATATAGYNALQANWAGSTTGGPLGFNGLLNRVISAGRQMFGVSRQPSGIQIKADEATYKLMATSPRLDITQPWYANPQTSVSNTNKKATSFLDQINLVSNTVMTAISNPMSLVGNAMSALFDSTIGNRGNTSYQRKKILAIPGGFNVINVSNGYSGPKLKGGRTTGYSINGLKYNDNVKLTDDGNWGNSDMLVQFGYYANSDYKYDTKFTEPTSTKVKEVSDNLKAVMSKIDGGKNYSVKTNTYSKLLSSGDLKSIGYDNMFSFVPEIRWPTNQIGASKEYNLRDPSKKSPPATLDKRINSGKNLKFATSFTSDGINQIGILSRNKSGDIEIPSDSSLKNHHGDWTKYDPYRDDLIAFFFYDVVNKKYIPFRATVKGISEGNTAFWDELRFIGRADQLYSYNGFSRTLSFSFNVVINSINELLPSWKKINYLASVVKPSNYTRGDIYNRFMVPPMFMLTIGDLYKYQPIVIRNVGINIPEDSLWETLNQDNSEEWSYLNGIIKNPQVGKKYGQLPREIEISIEGALLEKERAQVGGSHFGHAPRIDDWEDKLDKDGNLREDAFVVGAAGTDSSYYLPKPTEFHKYLIESLPSAKPIIAKKSPEENIGASPKPTTQAVKDFGPSPIPGNDDFSGPPTRPSQANEIYEGIHLY